MSAAATSPASCTPKARGLSLRVLPSDQQAFPHSPVRKSKTTRWRAAVLIAVHLIMIAHIVQWLVQGLTLSPVEPSESMYTLEVGKLNAGFVFFSLAIISTLLFGRFFCGWGCHMVAFQDLCAHWMEKLGVRPRQFRSRLLLWGPLSLAVYMFVWPAIRRDILWPLSQWWGRSILAYVYTHIAPSAVMAEWAGKLDLRLPFWMGEAFAFPGFSNKFLTEDYWATFPPWWMIFPFMLTCTFAMVYFLGSKGLCNYACPYGGFFGVADQLSIGHVVVNDRCNSCGHCTAVCTSNVRVHQEVKDYGKVMDPGCLRCMDCVSVCPNDALSFKFGKPNILTRPVKTPSARRPRFDLLPWEEIAVAIVAFVTFYAWRSAFNLVPMLMAASMGCIGGFLAWKLWSLARTPNIRIQSVQLRVKGRLKPAGLGLVAACIVFFGFTGWVGWVHGQRTIAEHLDARVTLSQDVVFSPTYIAQGEQKDAALRAVRLLDRAGPRDAAGFGWNLTPELWNRKAWLAAVAGDLPGAERALERGMCEGQPSEAIVIAMHRIHALQNKTNADFAAAMERIIAKNPKAWHARVALGYAQLQQNAPEAGLARFREVVASGSKADPGAVYRAVDAMVQMGHVDEAEKALDTLNAERPRAWELLDLRAMLALNQQDAPKAEQLLRRAIQRAPDNPALWDHLSQALQLAGKPADAKNAADEAVELQGGKGQ